jgi:mono/diheme cytochrome c family protein
MRRHRFWISMISTAAAMILGACAPTMPDYPAAQKTMWLDQGWTPDVRFRYHRTDQGTLTFGIPYEWFVALEQPVFSLNEAPPFGDKSYLDRFGFIPSDSPLPVGFARGAEYRDADMKVMNNPATGVNFTGVGLTCAACHTGRMTYHGTEFLIDGGSALTDVVDLNLSLVLAMSYTDTIPFRFNRFAARVLGDHATDKARDDLHAQFSAILKQQLKVLELEIATMGNSPAEGFGRLDAINRIGNRVFGLDMNERSNYISRTAPVHYPHIWTSSWFTWVQYNGSIMQPMVRNAGEALGVGAMVNLTSAERPLFQSTVEIESLHQIEQSLAGTPPFPGKNFSGLQSPRWPPELPPVRPALVAQGAGLYKELCQGCHLPPVDTVGFWQGKWWTQIGGKGERYLDLHQIPVTEIGTDPAQAAGMATRTVRLPENFNTLPDGMKFKSNLFGNALGQLVQNVTSQWYETRVPPVPAREQDAMNGGRPNSLQLPLEYKARPLNGIWATPPYLHNGSVPNLYALLSPVAERPPVVYLGNREFDPDDAGYKNVPIAHGFVLDTGIPGNRNTGHEFRDAPKGGGVIGRGLTPEERRSLIEYLKTL